MNDDIIKLREELVELSSDPIKTRELLDKLTEKEIEQHDKEAHFLVGKNDILETVDKDFYAIYKTRNGYALRYKGGYDVFVDDKLITPAGVLQSMMDGVPTDVDDEMKESLEKVLAVTEIIFRLPLFVFSHGETLFNIATMALQYVNLLQLMGEVPTEEISNPEYDKFLVQMNEIMENFVAGMEKEYQEYAKRNGYAEKENKSEGKNEDTESTK